MDRKDSVKKFLAGLFFIVIMIAIGSVVFIIGIEKGLTQPRFKMSVLFKKVGGLDVGAPVRLSGVNIGTVTSIDFLDKEINGRNVKVDLNLYSRFRPQVLKSVRIAIITEGVLGDKVVDITTDPGVRLADLDHYIIGKDPLDVQNLAETFGSTARSLEITSREIDGLTEQFNDMVLSMRRLLNRVEQKIIEGNLFKIF